MSIFKSGRNYVFGRLFLHEILRQLIAEQD